MLEWGMGEQVLGRVNLAEVGNRLRAARERAGLSPYRLAKMSGLSDTAIYLIEAGSRMPNVDTASRLAHALELTTSELIGERETIALSEPPEMSLARRAAPELAALKIDDPLAFLAALSSLPPEDQEFIADTVYARVSRRRATADRPIRVLGSPPEKGK